MIKKILQVIIIVYFLGMSALFSQSLSKNDSLINELTAESFPVSKEKRLEILKELAFINKGDSYVKSLEYGNMALILSREIKDQETEIEILNILAFVNNQLCNYSEADKNLKKLFEKYEQINDKSKIADIVFRIARNYYDWSNYAKAKEYYQLALYEFEHLKNIDGATRCFKGLGTIYLNWGDYQKAQNYFQIVLKYYEESNDMQGMAGTYNSLGVLYQDMGKLDRSLKYYMKALSIFKVKAQDWNIVNMTLHIGDIYLKKKEYTKALEYYLKADTLGKIIGHKKLISITLSNIGEVYNQMGEYLKALDCQENALKLKVEIGDNKRIAISLYELGLINSNLGNRNDALKYLLKSLEYANMVNFKDQQKKCYQALSLIYSSIGKNKKALDYRIKYDVLKDSLFNIETHKNIENLRLKYETEKREKEYEILNLEVTREIYYRNSVIIVLIIFTISAVIFVIFISNRSKIRRKNNEILKSKNKKISKQKEELDTLFNELRVSEERYKSIFEHATVGLYRTTPDGQVIFANPFIIKMLKYPSLDILVKDNLEERDYPRSSFKKTLEKEGRILGMEGIWERYDNSKIYVNESAWVVKDRNDKIIFYDGIVEDITDKKAAEKALINSQKKLREANKILVARNVQVEKAREQAENANKSKSMFLANMSHEIRTPLNAIIGFTDLLEGVIVDEKQIIYVESIKSSSRNLLSLINDILDLSKIQAGKIKLEYEPVNPHALFSDIRQIFDQKIKEKGLDFIIDISKEIPNSLILDEIKIRQILFNLIGNAIKFTQKGYIKISARKIIINKKKSTLDFLISVEDTGIGISKTNQNKIFDPFYQKEGQSQKMYGGTGLGLSITKRLVEVMGGEIIIESIIDKGSKFDVIIKDVSISSVLPEKYTKQEIDYNNIIFDKAKVLVADDVKTNRNIIKEVFDKTKIKIIEAVNGKEAIEKTKSEHPDLILMDIRMPLIDGFEAMKTIKNIKEFNNLPIIALTATAMKSDKFEIRKKGFDGILIKPVKLTDIINELIRFLKYTNIKKPSSYIKTIKSEMIEIENFSDEIMKLLPEIIRKIDDELVPLWKKVSENHFIHEIKDFAKLVKKFGADNNIIDIENFGSGMIKDAENFDVEKTNYKLNSFPSLIKSLKDLNKNGEK
ncbi:MAG: tetratricopeptide repeat protein [Bacteroidales bacterium]|nr:tetratricopeptide repeat protein [Bacteroidales bacterium]